MPVSADVLTASKRGQGPHYRGQPVWVGDVAGEIRAVVGLGLSDAGAQALLAADGSVLAETQVLDRAYAEQHLTLTQTQYVSPDPAQLERFEREAAEQKAAYRVHTLADKASWPRFQWPLQGRVSSLFGLRRFFNGEPRAPHLGIDIAGKSGTPVHAPANGRVALIGDYFFNGRTVIIDHGQGLFSMLCHFSDIRVKAGDQVTPDSVIGLVGATGRATAPHLHWTVSLNDARIDPRRLLVIVPETDR
ncbi:MAG: M23 family metallopeptidase [Pseudomonadota bacterium]